MPSFLINIDDKFNEMISKNKKISLDDLINLKSFMESKFSDQKFSFTVAARI